MRDIKEGRRRFRFVLAVLLAICLGSAGVLLSPIGSSAHARQRQLDELQAELQAKSLANVPLQAIDARLADAQGQIANFYQNRLPSSYASISERLWTVASDTGVSLTTGNYRASASGVPGMEHLFIDASITGEYLHAIKFINATEREPMFFLIGNISLTQQQGSTVQLQIRIEAFRKES
jgi:Tfp pilus assembly protein PilO